MIQRKSLAEISFDVFNILLMVLLCAVTVYPFLYVVSRSVMTDTERSMRPYALLPTQGLDWEAYKYIFSSRSRLPLGFAITVFRTVVGTVLSVLCEAGFAYALSKRYFPPRVVLTVMIAVTMWFSAGLIPRFLVVRAVGLYDTIWVYVVLPLMSAWYIFILRTFFSQLPESLEESAKMDGANDVEILFRIVLPISTAVLATVALFHIVYHWNEWFSGVIYVSNPRKVPAQALLWQILAQAIRAVNDDNISAKAPPSIAVQMAMIVVTAFPIVVAYPFFQKYFVKGMLIGSIKG